MGEDQIPPKLVKIAGEIRVNLSLILTPVSIQIFSLT